MRPSRGDRDSPVRHQEILPPLDLAFKTKRLRRLCENRHAAELALPPEVAAHLRDRLADVDAAERASDLIAGSPREAGGLLVLDLGSGYTLAMQANHNSVPKKGSTIDWRRVTRLQLISIGVPNA